MPPDQNPFTADHDRHAIWEMLMTRDFDAFLAANWSMVSADFDVAAFFGLHAHGEVNPDSWRLDFPTLDAYRDEWLRQAAETKSTRYAEPVRQALFRSVILDPIEISGDRAVAHKKFDGSIARADGSADRLNWQTLYLCGKRDGTWRITSFVGYMPLSASP